MSSPRLPVPRRAPQRSTGPARAPLAMHGAVLDWFSANGRRLAFRGTRDPYEVLVSEVMLQQTQVGRVEVAWTAFLRRFPTVEALAAARPAEVITAWQGLGYNRRAVSLQAAAREIVRVGAFPRSIPALRHLPGVGPYTARAVAALAMGEPVCPLDVNIRRVMGRVLGVGAATAGRADGVLQDAADVLVPPGHSAAWTNALMDIGATLCRVREPRCTVCPLRPWCALGSGAGPTQPPAEAAAPPAASATLSATPSAVFAASGSEREPFVRTNRWLRGRIVDVLRASPDGAFVRVVGPIGPHDEAAVARALLALARDHLVELRTVGGSEARLPQDAGAHPAAPQ